MAHANFLKGQSHAREVDKNNEESGAILHFFQLSGQPRE